VPSPLVNRYDVMWSNGSRLRCVVDLGPAKASDC
jgi:hypothetical protein